MGQIPGISHKQRLLAWHNWHTRWIVVPLCAAAASSQLSCGGSAESSGGDSGMTSSEASSSSTASNSSSSAGGASGSNSASGTNATSSTTRGDATSNTSAGGVSSSASSTTLAIGGGPVCCNALPSCPVNYTEVGDDGCPDNVECITVELCCDSVTCKIDPARCDAIPTCDPGDIEVSECPADASCYEASMCGRIITCQQVDCDPDQEPNREYVGLGDACQAIDFICSEQTEYFYNSCGCGCEQDESCPEFVNCQPGSGSGDPLCTDTETCPFTIRAQ